jgi:predicted thioesterase
MRTATDGSVVTMRVKVTEVDRAVVDEEIVHDVYGTAAMIRHVEQVSRWMFRQGLEEGEEGAGKSISLEHHAPVPIGAEVELTATVSESTDRKLVIDVQLMHDGNAAATAEFVQVLIDPESFGTDQPAE